METFVDLYTDYLISSTSLTTATGLSRLLEGEVSHDKITRSLSTSDYDSKYLWQAVKPMVEEICSSDDLVILSFDDYVEEKLYTDESGLVCWHYDHTVGRSVLGVQFLTALMNTKGMSLPCALEFVRKDQGKADKKQARKNERAAKPKTNCTGKCFYIVTIICI